MPPDAAAALAAAIDHTLLAPAATAADIERLCAEAVRHGFGAVCVNPWHLPRAAMLLRGTRTAPVTVAGFPLGAAQTAVKAREAGLAVEQGAAGVDMVLNLGAFLGGAADLAAEDIRQVVAACGGVPVKVILETCLLDDEQKVRACRLAVDAGAAFVKTSTGFAGGGATEADVRLLRRSVGPDIGVKASGGVRTREQALALLAAGADRIGASASLAIIGASAGGDES
jgi:deoxyribose-phosphate aldolase